MSLLAFLAAAVLAVSGEDALPVRHMRTERLGMLKGDEADIFTPHEVSHDGLRARHNVHVEDETGKYFRLSYDALHHEDLHVLKLDYMKDDVESVDCSGLDLVINAKDRATAERIHASLSVDDIVAGNPWWGCKDPDTGRFSPIIRKVASRPQLATDGAAGVFMRTTKATYMDVFDDFKFSMDTNMRMHHHDYGVSPQVSRRRLQSWWSDFVDAVTDGISKFVHAVCEVVEDVWDGINDVIDIMEGKDVTFSKDADSFWSYNYDKSTEKAASTFYLDSGDKANCVNCYAYFDMTLLYDIEFSGGTLTYLKAVAGGSAKMNVEVVISGDFNFEYDVSTPSIPIPYLSVGVAGITLGFTVKGAIGIGLEIDINYLYVGAMVEGDMTRGIEFGTKDKGNDDGTMNYISGESFDYKRYGPELEVDDMSISFYLRPKLYLTLEYVGDIYFGVEPRITFDFHEDQFTDTDCAIDYTPTAKLSAFVGAQLTPLNIDVWDKEASVQLLQVSLDSLAGCITKTQLLAIEEDTGIKVVRRLADDTTAANDTWQPAIVSYEGVPSYAKKEKPWGTRNTEWWGNETTVLTKDCGDSDREYGRLVLMVQDDSYADFISLLGLYQTELAGVVLANGKTTNVTCVSRVWFNVTDEYEGTFGIDTYDITTLETYCDVNETNLDKSTVANTWRELTTLPEHMYSIILQSDFRSAILFDQQWCTVFTMAQRWLHTESAQIEWLHPNPAQTLYGAYHCDNIGEEVRMSVSVQTYDADAGSFTAYIEYSNGYAAWFDGEVAGNFVTMTQQNDADPSWQITLEGYVSVLQDGTVVIAGSMDSDQCHGFLLQGYTKSVNSPDTTTDEVVDPTDDHPSGDNSPAGSSDGDASGAEKDTTDTSTAFTSQAAFGVLVGVLSCLVLIALALCIGWRSGYHFCVSEKRVVKQERSYELMGDTAVDNGL